MKWYAGVELTAQSTEDEVNNEWLARLESGDFQQVTGVLCRRSADGENLGMCCLGVLNEMAVEAGMIEPGYQDKYESRVYYPTPDPEKDLRESYDSMPHKSVLLWAGVKPDDPSVVTEFEKYFWDPETGEDGYKKVTERIDLVELNDSKDFTFAQIAAAIRADREAA